MAAAEKAGHGYVLILAPRAVARAADVVGLCRKRDRRVHRRSDLSGRHLVPGEVLVLDTIGELAALYATASIAFVGGTLVPVGGHNIVEPVHAGCPVLFGPHVENVRKIAEILAIGDAGRRVANSAMLAEEMISAFSDPDACRVRGEIGREMLEAHRGSVDATRQMIAEILPARDALFE
jgi:3-deoxy-D-manno-octulosonic-acid transferase